MRERPMKAACIVEGLQILMKYGHCNVDAQHDIFYAGPDASENRPGMSDDDIGRLEELGWFVDEECDSWAIFT